MIRLSRAPPGAVPPLPMPSEGLFQLDVDSDIWQDVGLGEGHPDPPKWLADEDVHKGIRLMLEEWFAVEWGCVEAALEDADEHYIYHLQVHKRRLVAVYVKWEAMVRHIPCAWAQLRAWGPTTEDIACLPATDQPTEELSEDGDSDEDLVSVEDLLMATEEVALVEEDYIGGVTHEQFTEDEDWLEDIGDGYLPSSPLRSPAKRCRR
ncbi:hypothetical protein F5141DRAFT_1189102 [Pisolithus sp. B1]|nr:hypothetical protein F5141DRAFT_1189102 [Pisolithus sp. B1]